MAKQLINSLQVFRGLAALAVVGHHAAVSSDAFVQPIPASWLHLFDLGAYGVDFFFVLSGFIIMHAHMREVGQPEAIKLYLVKRLARIFPAYWPIGLALLCLYAWLPTLSASGGRQFSYISSIFLLPSDLPPALSVAWTLVHELLFYAVFMLWFVSRRVFCVSLLLWTGLILANQLTEGGGTGWLRYPLSLLNLEFMLGVLAALLYGRESIRNHSGTLITGGGVLAITMLFMLYADMAAGHRLGLALGLALLLLGMAGLEQNKVIAWPMPLLALGNASYSIYLIHSPLLSLTQRMFGHFELIWPLALLLGVVLSVGFGYLYFLWIERRVVRLVRVWSQQNLFHSKK